jgi:D-glycero-D-manno-heptose 1,7-bisphosphate phosphatase
MLLEAAASLALDLPRSFIIGDSITDLQAGEAAGTQAILIRTGRGASEEALLHANGLAHIPVYPDLAGAVEALLAEPEL